MSNTPGLSGTQIDAIAESRRFLNVWVGAVSSGKTYAWLVLMLGEIQNAGPVGSLVIMGKNRDTIWRNVFEPLMTHPLFASARQHIQYRQGAPVARIYGKDVYVIGINDLGAEERIRGGTFQKVFYDELTLCPEPVFDMILTRMRAPGPPVNPQPPRVFATTNPGSQRHYLKTRFIDRADDTETFVKTFTMTDNPGLSESYIRLQRQLYTGVFYQRFILGRWVAAEGAVYQSWNEETMMVDELPELLDTVAVGLDYGTNHPTAGYALSVGRTWETDTNGDPIEVNRLYIHNEWSPNPGTQLATDKQLADSFEHWYGELPAEPQYIYADPAAASFREELRQRDYLTTKAANAVLDGIRLVDSLLVSGQLLVHKDCTFLRDELPEYVWDAKASERGEDKPVKENDDHVDALRYAVYSSRHLWRPLLTAPSRQSA